ncbi:hypothetical protein ACLI4Q_18810 [Natrialbaceae archaeon A-CW1-1]
MDLVERQTVSPELAEVIFDQDVLLLSDLEHVATLRRELTALTASDQSPRDRIDAALARIDEYLGGSAVTGSGSSFSIHKSDLELRLALRKRSQLLTIGIRYHGQVGKNI